VALSRRGGRNRFTLLFLVLTSITVITLDFRGDGDGVLGSVRNGAADVLEPVRSFGSTVFSPVGDALQGITGYGSLEDENAELRARLEELEGDAVLGEDARAELREMQRLRRLPVLDEVPRVTARVVGAPIGNFEQTIELDKGGDDGIREGMPVVTGAGLVGRVVSVSGARSVVRLVTDGSASVGVRILGTDEVAIASGEGPGREMSVGFVEPGVPVEAGDRVVTSGMEQGSALPAGIPVGRVTEVVDGPGRLAQEVRMEPLADLDHMRVVDVLQWEAAPAS
jgi:rod shape-determining protein MreC